MRNCWLEEMFLPSCNNSASCSWGKWDKFLIVLFSKCYQGTGRAVLPIFYDLSLWFPLKPSKGKNNNAQVEIHSNNFLGEGTEHLSLRKAQGQHCGWKSEWQAHWEVHVYQPSSQKSEDLSLTQGTLENHVNNNRI